MAVQTTVADSIVITGPGVHSAESVTILIHPAPANSGIRFRRADLHDAGSAIPAHPDFVADATFRTVLAGPGGAQIATIEHLMAAFAGCGVDNATVAVFGMEIPVLDGSAMPFARKLEEVGLRKVGGQRRAIRVLRPVEIRNGRASVRLEPAARGFSMAFTIRYPDQLIGTQHLELELGEGVARRELLHAPSFITADGLDAAQRVGIGGGRTLDELEIGDIRVIDNDRVLRGPPVSDRDVFVRHKMLDALGDLYLCGHPLIGRFVGDCSGHAMNVDLVRKLLADSRAWCREEISATATIVPKMRAESFPETVAAVG